MFSFPQHEVVTPDTEAAYRAAPCYAVAIPKLIVMSFGTLGLYPIYWFYWQWKAEQKRTGEELSPFWRTFFGVLWGFSLFRRLKALAELHGESVWWSSTWLAAAYLVLCLASRLPDPYWLIAFLGFVALLPVQASVNRLNARVAPELPRNSTYSGWQVAMLVVGTIILILAIIGVLMPDPALELHAPVQVSA